MSWFWGQMACRRSGLIGLADGFAGSLDLFCIVEPRADVTAISAHFILYACLGRDATSSISTTGGASASSMTARIRRKATEVGETGYLVGGNTRAPVARCEPVSEMLGGAAQERITSSTDGPESLNHLLYEVHRPAGLAYQPEVSPLSNPSAKIEDGVVAPASKAPASHAPSSRISAR